MLLIVCGVVPAVHAGDGATEALELRFHAEHAIVEESVSGDAELAGIMRELLPGMLVEHLVARDETITLDTVDAAFVQDRFKQAALMEEPGVAMALDVFVGPGTGYEHGIRTSIANLADFAVRMDDVLPDNSNALDAHERVMARHLEKLLVRDLDDKLDRIAEAAEQALEAAAEAAEQVEEAAVEVAEAAAEAVEEVVDVVMVPFVDGGSSDAPN